MRGSLSPLTPKILGMVILAGLRYYHGKGRRPREMSPIKPKRGVVFAPHRTQYRAYLEAMVRLGGDEVPAWQNPPISFNHWARGQAPEAPA